MVKKMRKKTVILWILASVLLSACVYLSLPTGCEKTTETKNEQEQKTEEANLPSELDLEAIVEAYFSSRPVRDVPQTADFSSFLVATFAKSQRDFKKTAEAYTAVLKSDSDNQEIKDILYQYYILAGLPEEAFDYALAVLDKKPNDLLPSLAVATVYAKKQNFEEILKIIQKLNENSNAFLSPLLKAWTYVGLDDKKQALTSLEVLQDDPTLYSAYLLHKAMISDYFNDTQMASELYNKLLKRNESKNVRILLLLKEFEARTHLLEDKKSFALQYATMQEESFIAKEMLSTPKDGGRVISAEQGISWVLFDMASAMSQIKDLDLALFFARLALYLNPQNTVIQLFVGEILEAMELSSQANAFYQIVTPNQNIFLSVQMRTIMNQIKMKQFSQAIQTLNTLIKAFPNGALLHMTLGDAYRELEDYQNALLSYKKATELANPNDAQISLLYFYQGVCLEAMEDLEQASVFFEKALELEPQNPIYLNYAGYTWLEQGKNIPLALSQIEKAVAKMPNDGNILDSLGWAYYLTGDYKKALTILEKAVSLQAGNAILNSHLGDVYWKLGRYREARFQWSHALTLKESSTPKLKTELTEKIAKGLDTTSVATKE